VLKPGSTTRASRCPGRAKRIWPGRRPGPRPEFAGSAPSSGS